MSDYWWRPTKSFRLQYHQQFWSLYLEHQLSWQAWPSKLPQEQCCQSMKYLQVCQPGQIRQTCWNRALKRISVEYPTSSCFQKRSNTIPNPSLNIEKASYIVSICCADHFNDMATWPKLLIEMGRTYVEKLCCTISSYLLNNTWRVVKLITILTDLPNLSNSQNNQVFSLWNHYPMLACRHNKIFNIENMEVQWTINCGSVVDRTESSAS
jgi:hypothetical protein